MKQINQDSNPIKGDIECLLEAMAITIILWAISEFPVIK